MSVSAPELAPKVSFFVREREISKSRSFVKICIAKYYVQTEIIASAHRRIQELKLKVARSSA